MHINLRKPFLVLGIIILAISYAGISSLLMPAVSFAQTTQDDMMSNGSVPTVAGYSSVLVTAEASASPALRPAGAASGIASDMNADGLSQNVALSQPLGSLSSIAWNSVDSAPRPSILQHLLILPFYNATWTQADPGVVKTQLVDKKLIDAERWSEVSILPQSIGQSQPAAFVDCGRCHIEKPEHTVTLLQGAQ